MDEELREVGAKWSAQELDKNKEYLINVNCDAIDPKEASNILKEVKNIFIANGFDKCIFTISYSDKRMMDLYEICKKENIISSTEKAS